MTNKIATVKAGDTKFIDAPIGVEIGGFSFTMRKGTEIVGSPIVTDDEKTGVKFTITEPGIYTFELARIAKSGEAIASPAESDPFTVTPDQVLVPLTVSVVIADAVEVPASVAVAVA